MKRLSELLGAVEVAMLLGAAWAAGWLVTWLILNLKNLEP